MLDPEAGERFGPAVVHGDGEMDSQFSLGILKPLVDPGLEVQMLRPPARTASSLQEKDHIPFPCSSGTGVMYLILAVCCIDDSLIYSISLIRSWRSLSYPDFWNWRMGIFLPL